MAIGDSAFAALERHFTAKQIAEAWGLSERTIRDLFRDEPGVLKIGAAGRRLKRDYVSIRIPETVLARVYATRTKVG